MVAAAIAIKLLVRRRAPMGGWFTDSPRSAGTLSVIGTMFAVILAFVIFLALQSYQRARDGASVEAIAVTELDSVAGVFQSPSNYRLHGGLVCYARAVVNDEWPAMRNGRSSEVVQLWIDNLGRDFASAEPHGAREETAYAQWFDQQAQRREGRRQRLAEATPFVPPPLWFVLGIGAFVTIAYMCAQADRREGALIQSIPIGFLSALVTAGLLVVFFLDHPYANESGSIMPTEMHRTLALLDRGGATPCDDRGNPRPT
ncbi:MAG: bestrophin-like domain [Mycobacterium sp.]